MTKVFAWLGERIDRLVPHPPAPPLPVPAKMTDGQLHRAIHDVGAGLLNGLAPVIQDSFARYGSSAEMGDPRFPHAMPVKVRGHILTMVTEANDAFGLSLLGLREHATAAALGAIRIVAETLVWTRWLLENPDEGVRQARAFRRTLNAIEGYVAVGKTLRRVAGQSKEAEAGWLAAAGQRMQDDLAAMAGQDGIDVASNPGSLSKLMEQYLPERGGYLFYALLNSSGAHPGAARAFQFYGAPGTGVDFDFKGKYVVRAYWIAESILLHLAVCELAAPILGWAQDWHDLAEQTRNQIAPLAEEAERRFAEPLRRAMVSRPNLHRPEGTDDLPPGPGTTA